MANKKFVPEYGNGSFYEEKINGKKYYVFEWPTPDKRRNPRKRFPYTKEGEKERELFAKDIISKLAAGVQTRSNETFGEWLLYFITECGKANTGPDTINRKLQYAKNIPDSVANTLLDKLDGKQLQEMITGMQTDPSYRNDGKKKPLASSTCKKIYELVFASLEKARKWRKIQRNPMEDLEKPTTGDAHKKKKFFSNDELRRFIAAYRKLSEGKYRKRMRKDYYNLFFLLYSLGVRIGELLALTWNDIDLVKQVVRIDKSKKSNKAGQHFGTPKTASGIREIPILFDSTHNRLLKMQEAAGNKGFLFPTKSGKALGYRQVERVFNQICELADIKGKTIHEFRHTYGTIMAKATGNDGKPMPIAELSRIMGHSKVSTTQDFYVHSDEAQNEALLKSFANQKRRKPPKKD